jgi:hypothetical protein
MWCHLTHETLKSVVPTSDTLLHVIPSYCLATLEVTSAATTASFNRYLLDCAVGHRRVAERMSWRVPPRYGLLSCPGDRFHVLSLSYKRYSGHRCLLFLPFHSRCLPSSLSFSSFWSVLSSLAFPFIRLFHFPVFLLFSFWWLRANIWLQNFNVILFPFIFIYY